MTDREKLVAEMAKVLLELQPEKPIYSISMSSRAAVMFADAILKVAERALAEKHARIAVNELLKMQSTHAVTSAVYRAIRMSVPANLVASVEKKDD